MHVPQATLTLEGLYGRLDTNLPPHLNNNLLIELQATDQMSWVDVKDLNKRILFIGTDAGGTIWYLHGVHEIVAFKLKALGFQVVERRKVLPAEFPDWRISVPHDHPSQPTMIKTLIEMRRGAVQAPPGTGKTYVIAATTAVLKVPTLCLTYNTKPTKQVHESFGRFTNIKAGMLLGDVEDTQPVTVANASKLQAMLKSERGQEWWRAYGQYFKLVIVDEAHHLASLGTRKILEALPGLRGVMAVSATYGRADDLAPVLLAYGGPLWYKVPLEEVVGTKLVPLTIEVATVPGKSYGAADDHQAKKKSGEIQGLGSIPGWQANRSRNDGLKILRMVRKDYIVQGSTGRNDIIAKYVANARRNRRTGVIIIDEIEHAEVLCSLIPNLIPLVKSDGGVMVKKSSEKEAERIVDALRHREIDWIISTTFDEAVDVPSLDCVVLAAGGKSWIKAEQRLRNTRTCNMQLRTGHYVKERGYVLLFRDNAPMIKKHAEETIAEVRKYVKSHPDNEYKVWEPNEDY